jgi:hypothetical protein
MKRTTRTFAAAGIAALGVGLLGGPAAASPAGRGHGPGDGTCDGTGQGRQGGARAGTDGATGAGAGDGHQRGPGARAGTGTRAGAGACAACTDPPAGTVTAEQRDDLAYWVEEEKVARDLYTAFAARYDLPRFERIAAAESRHMAAVRTLLARYDVTDPSAGAAPGAFTDDELQAMYDRLLAEGTASLTAALGVGRTVEEDDIAMLTEAAEGVTAPDVLRVIEAQRAASERHLVAFGG